MVDRISEIGGVYVESIKVETKPYDRAGEIQDRVGEGITINREFFPSEMVGVDSVSNAIEAARDTLSFLPKDFRLKYNLLVRARSQESAGVKSRSYVRAVNPFSPGLVNVSNVGMATDKDWLTETGPLVDFYNVTVSVEK